MFFHSLEVVKKGPNEDACCPAALAFMQQCGRPTAPLPNTPTPVWEYIG